MRVTVLGNSCGLIISQRPPAEDRRTYAQHLEELLGNASGPARVHNASRFGRSIDAANRDWEQHVLAERPDLLVVNHGVLECRTAAVPLGLLRWAHTSSHTESRTSVFLQRAVRVALPVAFRLAAAVEATVPMPGHKSAARFGRQLDRILRQTQMHLGIPVAVLDVPPPTPLLRSESPGYEARRARLQATLEQVVARHPFAYRVDLSAIEQELGLANTYGDGIHFSAAAHRRVAELISRDVQRSVTST